MALNLTGAALLLFTHRDLYIFALWIFAAVGISGLLRCIFQAQTVTSWYVLMVSLCMGYGLGTLNTELTYLSGLQHYVSITYAGPYYLQRAVAWLMLSCSVLCVCSSLDSRHVFANINISDNFARFVVYPVLVLAVIVAVQIGTGSIGYHGNVTGEGSSVSPVAALTGNALCPVTSLGCFLIGRLKGVRKGLTTLGMLVLALALFYQGRRVFIYAVVLAMMCFFAANPPKRLMSKGSFIALLMAALAITTASKAFFALRMATYEMGTEKSTLSFLKKGAEIMLNSKRAGLDEELALNEQSRTFIVGYMGALLAGLEDHPPLYGDVAIFDVAMSVPSALWPGKYRVIALGAEEGVANSHFGLPMSDDANSIVTAGLSDFGVFGVFLYPLFVAAMYAICLRQSQRLPPYFHLMIVSAAFNTLLNVEGGLADHFNIVRTIAIYAAAGFLIWWLAAQWGPLRHLISSNPLHRSHLYRFQAFIKPMPVWLAKLRRSGKTSAS
jgi:hypothetical protein